MEGQVLQDHQVPAVTLEGQDNQGLEDPKVCLATDNLEPLVSTEGKETKDLPAKQALLVMLVPLD